jgi:hypothetical protein
VPFPDKRDHRITRAQAKQMCKNHKDADKGKSKLKAGAFTREIIDEILAQAGCAGLRIYLGRTDAGEETLMLVGTDADGNDLANGTIADHLYPCPPFCGGDSIDS